MKLWIPMIKMELDSLLRVRWQNFVHGGRHLIFCSQANDRSQNKHLFHNLPKLMQKLSQLFSNLKMWRTT